MKPILILLIASCSLAQCGGRASNKLERSPKYFRLPYVERAASTAAVKKRTRKHVPPIYREFFDFNGAEGIWLLNRDRFLTLFLNVIDLANQNTEVQDFEHKKALRFFEDENLRCLLMMQRRLSRTDSPLDTVRELYLIPEDLGQAQQ